MENEQGISESSIKSNLRIILRERIIQAHDDICYPLRGTPHTISYFLLKLAAMEFRRKINPKWTSYRFNKILTLWPSWHEDPKSTILIADRLGLQRRIFSGFKSQCIILSSGVERNNRAVHNCWANLRVKFNETPRKLVFRSKSYKLYDSNSNTKHKWLRHIKCRFSLTENRENRWTLRTWKHMKISYPNLHIKVRDDR